MALWARDALSILAPQSASRFQDIPFDLPVLIFTLVVDRSSAVLLFGLWPAWQSSRADVQLALKAGFARKRRCAIDQADARLARHQPDCAHAHVALSRAALVLKSFSRLQALSLGYEPRGMLTARLEMPWRTLQRRATRSTCSPETLLDKVRDSSRCRKACRTKLERVRCMGGWQTGFWREGTPQPTAADMLSADLEVVRGRLFSTLKVPLLRGRTFNERDTKDSPRVIVVDQAMVDKYFPGEDPIGKRLMCRCRRTTKKATSRAKSSASSRRCAFMPSMKWRRCR